MATATAHQLIQPEHSVFITSETDRLRWVIVGIADTLSTQFPPEALINQSIQKNVALGSVPTRSAFVADLERLAEVLSKHGIRVDRPVPDPTLQYQIFTRDVGFVIGDTYFRSSMAKPVRRREADALHTITGKLPSVVEIPSNLIVEGGDIIVDGTTVYVGLSQRTCREAIPFLRDHCPLFHFMPVPLPAPTSRGEALHLDCAFVPVGLDHALAHLPSLPPNFSSLCPRTLIEVTDEEQSQLATNVLSIDHQTVICRDTAVRIMDILDHIGMNCIPLPFHAPPLLGGSFRCCTLPLSRMD